jgi:hypothetical protein
MRRLLIALAACSALAAPAGRALAWGDTGHRMIGRLAMEALPKDAGLPAFLLAPSAVDTVEEYAREPDRWRKAGRLHDSDRDPAHFIDLDDDGKTLGGSALAALPPRRVDYQASLAAMKVDEVKAGYLPYAIADGWQQLVKDLAYWRVETAAKAHDKDPQHQAWYAADIARREDLVIRDLGVWAHYVGDGSMPLHTSIHFNGWGAEYPNPQGFTQEHVHTPWEAFFVKANVKLDAVRAAMRPYRPCQADILGCTAAYLGESNAQVIPFYSLDKSQAFKTATPEGVRFTTVRVAAGASELRDLVLDAWAASATLPVGYPGVSLKEVENGGIDPWIMIYGDG